MIVEHYYDDSSSSVILPGAKDSHPWDGEPRFCCSIEGESWEDCMRKYHEHMGWEPYKPIADRIGKATAVGLFTTDDEAKMN